MRSCLLSKLFPGRLVNGSALGSVTGCMVIIIIHSTFKNPPHTYHLLITVCVGRKEKKLGRSRQRALEVCNLPAILNKKWRWAGAGVERHQEARREERDQVLVDGRTRRYCVREDPKKR